MSCSIDREPLGQLPALLATPIKGDLVYYHEKEERQEMATHDGWVEVQIVVSTFYYLLY